MHRNFAKQETAEREMALLARYSIQAAVPGPWQYQRNVNRVTPNVSKTLSIAKITMNTTI